MRYNVLKVKKYLFLLLCISAIVASDIRKINIEGLSSDNINSIYYGENGILWLATDQGLNKYDGVNNSVYRSNPFITTALNGNRIWHVEGYNTDTLLVVSDNALHLFTPKNYSFIRFNIESRPTSIYKDGSEFWVTSRDKGVYRLDQNKTLHHYKFDPLNPFSIPTSEFEFTDGVRFATDNDGKTWLATEKGLCSIDKNTNFVSRYFRSNTNNKLLSDKINSLFFENGVLYIGTEKGLNYLSVKDMAFTSENDLKNYKIYNIIKDDDTLLVVTDRGIFSVDAKTVNRFSEQRFKLITTGLQGDILWSKNSTNFYYNGTIENVKATISQIVNTKNGDFLISTNEGVYTFGKSESGVFESNKKLSISDKIIFKKLFDLDIYDSFIKQIDVSTIDDYDIYKDSIWFIKKGSIFSYSDNVVSNYEYNPRDPNTFPKQITSVNTYDNFLWVGSAESGLFKYDLNNLDLIKHYQFDIKNPTSLQTSIVTSLVSDSNDNLWVGSGGDGLFKFEKESDGFLKFNSSSGLKSEIITDLNSYKNILLVITKEGVNYLKGGELLFKSLDREDGLFINDFSNLEFYSVDSNLFAKVDKQVFGINFDLIETSASNYKPVINEIIGIDSKNNRLSLDFVNNSVVVPHDITSLEIGVSIPSLYKAKQNLYSYRFGSKNSNPLIIKKAGEVISIPKRGYFDKVLELGDKNKESIFSTVSFDYRPPWYFTWWAITSYLVFAFGGIYVFTAIRAKKLQQQLEESRRSEELEEARNLQLQLLAKKVPEIKHVEVETYIRTATEVGGDYYDFFELDDGTLIAACGDATGHGATSGMMVSITKAGLKGIEKRSPHEMLTDLNNIVKSVEIGRIRMSLNLLEFKNGHVNISSAAMPPVYHYSKKTNSVNEIELVGTPLGSFYDEEFDKYQIDFEDGDALVLMSDGLPEAPNHNGEMLDYPAVKRCIKENGSKSASGIKDSLIELSDRWLDGIQNPDDITLVIFKKNKAGKIANA